MNYLLIVFIVTILLAIIVICATGYVKAPPDMAEIVKTQTFEGQTTKNINFTGILENNEKMIKQEDGHKNI